MTSVRGLTLVAVLVTGLVFSGCSGGASDQSPSPSVSDIQSATPTPSPSSTTTETPTPSTSGEQAAVDAVVAYLRVVDRLGGDPDLDLAELNSVATGQALAQAQHNLMQYRVEGLRQSGTQVPAFVASAPGATAAEWSITMCVDVSQVDILDSEGNSVKNPDSVPRLQSDFLVQQGPSEIWYVANDEVVATC